MRAEINKDFDLKNKYIVNDDNNCGEDLGSYGFLNESDDTKRAEY